MYLIILVIILVFLVMSVTTEKYIDLNVDCNCNNLLDFDQCIKLCYKPKTFMTMDGLPRANWNYYDPFQRLINCFTSNEK